MELKVVSLTKEREGEIALEILKHQFMRNPHVLNKKELKRSLGQDSKELERLGITVDELYSLFKKFTEEAVKNLFEPSEKEDSQG